MPSDRRLGLLRITPEALRSLFSGDFELLDFWVEHDNSIRESVKCLVLKIEADWCPKVEEGSRIPLVNFPEGAA